MATTFKQMTATNGFYLWSTPANWTNGVPYNGATVTINVVGGGNPSSYDDIAGLYLDSLTVQEGYFSAGVSLEIGSLSFGVFPSVVDSDTLQGGPATLTIDGFSGTAFGYVGAFGAGAVTDVLAKTDPGEIYQVDEGGELLLAAVPNASSGHSGAGFYYEDSVGGIGQLPSGTFAFDAPGSTVSSLLSGVAIGDSIALPGSDVSAVIFGPGSLSISTNLGTTVFSDVSYSGARPTGYTVSTDPTGLERVTFTSQQSTTFEQTTATNGFYLWSTPANWTNGVPANGAAVTIDVMGGGNPSSYDDIAGLSIDSLTLQEGYLAVATSLQIGSLSFGVFPSVIEADTLQGGPATLTIDGFGGTAFGYVGAFGAGAVTEVLAKTDPGEIYQVDEGGELLLAATPNASSGHSGAGFYYEDSVGGIGQIPSGTFAFDAPGSTVSSLLSGVAIGDSIALPGSDVSAVIFGPGSFSISTNLGTTVFSDVSYSGTKPTGYTVSTDPTGLERVTFTSQQSTTFEQTTATNGFYLWSTAANWTNGVPSNGAAVTIDVIGGGNPSSYDDIAGLYLDSLALQEGYFSAGASLEIGSLSFGVFPSEIDSDTLQGGPATLTIDGFSGTAFGYVGAFGAGAVTDVLAKTDPGEIYQVDEGGELLLAAAPNASSGHSAAGFYYEDSVGGIGQLPSGTFAFDAPGSTVSSLLSGVAIGDSIALPGSDVSAVIFGPGSFSISTNLGTTVFNDVSYSGTKPTGYTVSTDPTGLERVTFTSQQSTTFEQTTASNGFYLWSTAANWTNGVPSNGAAVTIDVIGGGNPSSYDDIAGLSIDSLTLQEGYFAAGVSLAIGSLSFGVFPSEIDSDTLQGGPATLTIDGFSGTAFGYVGAFGAGAVTDVLAKTDPGEIYQVDEGGELLLAATPNASSGHSAAGFYYEDSVGGIGQIPSGTFAFDAPGSTVSSLLSGVAIGDSIALPGNDVSAVTFGASSLSITTNLGTTLFSNVSYSGTLPNSYTVSTDPSGLEQVTFACYCRGTLILTDAGEIAVEDLQIGDRLVTISGAARPLRWIGRRSYTARFAANNPDAAPIRISAGTLGDGLPRRDLHVSPLHAMYLDGVLIPARQLVNGTSIVQLVPDGVIEYFHLELDNHDVILAEGAAAESFVDDDSRMVFHNAAEYARLYPDADQSAAAYCAPRVVQGFALEALRRRIACAPAPFSSRRMADVRQ